MSTLSHDLPAVNQPATVTTWYTYHATPKPDPDASDGPDLAYKWGHEDATEGNDQQGGAYFPLESAAWRSYNEGYAAGLLVRKQTAPPSELDEIEFMTQASDSFRRSTGSRPADAELVEAYVQAVALDADELDAEEWIGNAFSTQPYLY